LPPDTSDDPRLPASGQWHPPIEPGGPLPGPEATWRPPPRRRDRPLLHLALFLATIVSTMYFGSLHYASFEGDLTSSPGVIIFMQGAWYSFTILAILGTHEMGHYLACRYYRVDASLPFFLPAPFITGTIGAFIRIRSPIPTKAVLFDIGAAGPIAGFVVAVPALFIGLTLSRVVPLPENFEGLLLGEPILFQAAAWLVWGTIEDGYSINLHPMGFAAWFGLLATSLNLFPIGQLDGGHISYAALGGRSTLVTITGAVIVVSLTMVSLSWLIWAVMMVTMLVVFGPRHPPTIDHHVPLDRTRRWVAAGTLGIFVLCFTPAPIQVTDFLGAQPPDSENGEGIDVDRDTPPELRAGLERR
jgi:membrane-associated protease RseP (regulator of RpoE activity)